MWLMLLISSLIEGVIYGVTCWYAIPEDRPQRWLHILAKLPRISVNLKAVVIR
jgi:hypothetical protein